MQYIYALSNPRDSKIRYIGKTNNPEKRLKAHIKGYNEHGHKCNWIKKLQRDGVNPQIKIIGEYEDEIINNMEIFWIDYFKRAGCSLTNHNNGGTGGNNIVWTEDRRKKHSDRIKKAYSEGKYHNTSESLSGEGNPFYGKKHSDESRLKMSQSKLGKRSGKDSPVSRSIEQYDKDGKLIKYYDTISSVKEYGFNGAAVGQCLRGFTKTSGGFIWKYA